MFYLIYVQERWKSQGTKSGKYGNTVDVRKSLSLLDFFLERNSIARFSFCEAENTGLSLFQRRTLLKCFATFLDTASLWRPKQGLKLIVILANWRKIVKPASITSHNIRQNVVFHIRAHPLVRRKQIVYPFGSYLPNYLMIIRKHTNWHLLPAVWAIWVLLSESPASLSTISSLWMFLLVTIESFRPNLQESLIS